MARGDQSCGSSNAIGTTCLGVATNGDDCGMVNMIVGFNHMNMV